MITERTYETGFDGTVLDVTPIAKVDQNKLITLSKNGGQSLLPFQTFGSSRLVMVNGHQLSVGRARHLYAQLIQKGYAVVNSCTTS